MAATQLLGRTLLSAVALIGAMLVPVTVAAQPAQASQAASVMRLSVDTVRSTAPETVYLACEPAYGSHPSPEAACQALAAVNGNFSALSPTNPNTACPMIYSPVTATAFGYWHDSPVRYEHTYANYCLMLKDTGAVFDF